MKIFSLDFFAASLFLLLIATAFSSACTSRKIESDVVTKRAQPNSLRGVNINSADQRTLEKIPGIGTALARKIIEHRTRYGTYRRIEDLMLVEGVSDRRFREIRHLITVN